MSVDKELPDSTISAHLAILHEQQNDVNQRIAKLKFKWWAWVLTFTGGFVGFGYIAVIFDPYKSNTNTDLSDTFVGAIAILGAVIVPAAYAVSMAITKNFLESYKRDINHQIIRTNSDQLKESIEQDFFTKLVKLNFRYLDQYYFQTQQQADKSFHLSCFAAITGFIIIIFGIILMLFKMTETAYITTAAGVIGEFISAIFFYLYNRSIIKMSEYHQKLVLTQNISLALKLTEGLPEKEKTQSQQSLVDHLSKNINMYLQQKSQDK